jgi:hypothetical protein
MLSIEAIRLNASTLSLTLLFLAGFYLIYRDMRKMEESWKKLDASLTEVMATVADISSALEMPFDFPEVCAVVPQVAGAMIVDEAPPVVDTPVVDTPVVETPVVETPVADTPEE